ncbi:hypothetical protein LJC59_04565 [Desulfovibrio sp. OttesenSCG-928-A18]|nr:hypothetical protein [Desulfovibrio sp. OttesenSCG-928-A18]
MALAANPEKKYLLIRSAEEVFPTDALEEIKSERMVTMDEEATFPPCRVEIVLGLAGRFFVILPTGITTKLPFACNAPFIQDPARLKIKEPDISPTNRWLLKRIGDLAGSSLLAWLKNEELRQEERASAYNLLSDVDRKDFSLEGICATLVEEAIDDAICETECLLTETGKLASWGSCASVPDTLLKVWDREQIVKNITNDLDILSSAIIRADQQKLSNWQAIQAVNKSHLLSTLKAKRLPRPSSWKRLMLLWEYLSEDVTTTRYGWGGKNLDVHIVPIQGSDLLYCANEVSRIGEKRLLHTEEDWSFLAEYLLVLDPNWPRFLGEQRRKAEGQKDNDLRMVVESAHDLLEKLGLTQTSDASILIRRVAEQLFAKEDCTHKDCIRLAQIAAALNADVSEEFEYINSNGLRIYVDEYAISNAAHNLDLYISEEWLSEHILHDDYDIRISCDEKEWSQWAASTRSGLLGFVPIEKTKDSIYGRSQIQRFAKNRGYEGGLHFHFVTHNFIVNDFDFSTDHWNHWDSLSKNDSSFWGKLFLYIIKQPAAFWSDCLSSTISQIATSGTVRQLYCDNLPSSWIIKFRDLPCLQDTRGNYRQPSDLLRRTPDTEALLDVEPFLHAEYDTEALRPLLIALGVRDTPTGPTRILSRLRQLATVENPPLYELEKWYHRIDKIADKCSSEEFQEIRDAFTHEKLILSDNNAWCMTSEVFLAADEDEAPGVAVLHPSFTEFVIWRKLGIAERPTGEMALEWLSNLESGKALSTDEARRVRSLLPRYPERIWSECGHWLNLEGEWVPIDELSYSVSMQTLVPWKNLFTKIKAQTADFQKIPFEISSRTPFTRLASLSSSIQNHLDKSFQMLTSPQEKPWLNTLGHWMKRILLDGSEEEILRIRNLASRLAKTRWQRVSNLRIVPYIEGRPVGTPRIVDALWDDLFIYVTSESQAKMFKPIVNALGREFDKPELIDAIQSCYDRSSTFISEYIANNFKILSEDALAPTIPSSKPDEQKKETAQDAVTHPRNLVPGEVSNESPFAPIGEKGQTAASFTENLQENPDALGGEVNSTEDCDNGYSAPLKRPPSPPKPSLIERFALASGFQKSSSGHRFYQPDTGEYLERVYGNSFPWERYSATGELLQCYWDKDVCLENEALQIGADVWDLCTENPQKYSLLLSDSGGEPVEYSGETITILREREQLKVFPANYRVVYEHNTK